MRRQKVYKVQRIDRSSRVKKKKKNQGEETSKLLRKHSQQYILPAYRIILDKENDNRTS